MDRDQRKAFVLIGGFALVLVGAFLFFGWRGLFGDNAGQGKRQAFAEASPTPKANARQASESEGEITTVSGAKLEGIKPVFSPVPSATPRQQSVQKKENYQMVAFYTAARPAGSPTPVPDPPVLTSGDASPVRANLDRRFVQPGYAGLRGSDPRRKSIRHR